MTKEMTKNVAKDLATMDSRAVIFVGGALGIVALAALCLGYNIDLSAFGCGINATRQP